MRRKILFAVTLTVALGTIALSPRAALAKGDVVAVKDNFAAGTIVVRTSERRLYLILGGGQALRYPVGVGRAGMQWAGNVDHRGQVHRAGMVAAKLDQARKSAAAGRDTERFAAQSDGGRSDDAGRRRVRHPRHQRSGLDRPFRFPRLHPHVQR